MESRRSGRVIINVPSEIICESRRFPCSIENLSPEGAYLITAPAKSSHDFAPDSLLELRFQFPSGEKINLQCKIKWSYSTPPHGFTHSIGVEIIDPPQTYKETVKTLE